MAGVTSLPKFVVFYSESVGKYAKFAQKGAIQVMGMQAWSPYSRFEVEQSELHQSMVHIRCSYNNKYLRLYNEDITNNYIYPLADEPEDDQTKWTSTLFTSEFSSSGGGDDEDTVSLLHVHRGLYIQCFKLSEFFHFRANSPTPRDPNSVFKFTDWESLVTLPKHLRFKGDNGAYLGLLLGESGVTLRFQIRDYDPNNKTIVHELVALSDGTVRIMNTSQGAFWRLNTDSTDGYILADGSTDSPTMGSVFQPFKVDDKIIVVRNMENGLYCKRYPAGTPDNSLCANEHEVIDYAHLELIELVTSRMIDDIAFDQSVGWVYDKTENVTLNDKGQVVSNETDETKTIATKIYYKDTKTSSTWASFNSSLKLGPLVTIKPDQIPVVTDSSTIAMSDPFQESYVWGETTKKDYEEYKVHSVTLQPWTMVTVQMKASLATCHVPFAYTRYDVLDETTRQQPWETRAMNDGVYTGTNYFNFTFYESEPKPVTKKN